jgi:hypothetical protein
VEGVADLGVRVDQDKGKQAQQEQQQHVRGKKQKVGGRDEDMEGERDVKKSEQGRAVKVRTPGGKAAAATAGRGLSKGVVEKVTRRSRRKSRAAPKAAAGDGDGDGDGTLSGDDDGYEDATKMWEPTADEVARNEAGGPFYIKKILGFKVS